MKGQKNPAAVELGRLGGKARAESLSREQLSQIAQKGVRARMRKLSPKRRKDIAKKASAARWSKRLVSKSDIMGPQAGS
jgi:hypothetical protein